MKNWKLFISYLIFTGILFVSCATKHPETVQLTDAEPVYVEEIEEVVIPEPTAEELFLEKINGIKIEFINIPAKVKKNKAFGSAYSIKITDSNGSAVSNFEVKLKVPVRKEAAQLVFEEIKMISDENGIINYEPQKPDFCAQTEITAMPFIPSELNISEEDVANQIAKAAFLVESDITAKGAILFVFEYNENGKSPKNSYDILSGLRKKGVSMIGNAPISDDTSYINASKEKIYKENFEYVGTDFGYLIGGTIKFTNPVQKNEDGTYTANMVAYLYGIDMKTGEVIYEQTIENTSEGANWNKAVDSCKTKLTADAVDSLMFGL